VETSKQSHIGRGKRLLQHRDDVPLRRYVVDGFRTTWASSIRLVEGQACHLWKGLTIFPPMVADLDLECAPSPWFAFSWLVLVLEKN
jgi:hypothetical protein